MLSIKLVKEYQVAKGGKKKKTRVKTRVRTCSCHAQEDKLTGEAGGILQNDD